MNTNIKSFKFARHVLRNMKKKGDDMDPELWDKYFGPDTIVISGDEKNPDYDYISDYDSDTDADDHDKPQ